MIEHATGVQLIACPKPFSTARIERAMPEGGTVADMLRAIGLNPDPLFARVFIDDRLVLKAEWEWTVPYAGQLVTVRVIPTEGGGGKDALRIVAMIGVVIASLYTAGGALGAFLPEALGMAFASGTTASAVAGVGVSIAGSLAVGALIPPAKPKLQDLSRLNLSPALSLTGSANQLAPYAPIPRPYGRYRIFPSLAAKTYTETVGSDQYLRLLFCCGYGPLALSEMKIGTTPLESFQEVQMEVRYGFPDDPPITLFPDDVYEDALSVVMAAGVWQNRTTQSNVREIVVEWLFPEGLATYFSDIRGDIGNTVTFSVEYRQVGSGGWTVLDLNEPPVIASLDTDFGVANSDLRFTAPDVGYAGNNWRVTIETNVGFPAISVEFIGTWCLVRCPVGTTAAAIVDAIRSAEGQVLADRLSVALAPGSDGTGAVTDMSGYLSGGRDGVYPLVVSRNTRQPFRYAVTIVPPDSGLQYDVRVTVTKLASEATLTRTDTVYWAMLRTIQTGQPVSKPGLCLIAMRIKATGQLNGTLDQFNCIAESILPDWDGTNWVARPTSNPASIYRNILQGSANARPLPDSRLDLVRLAQFHESCAAQGWTFNANIDYRTTVFELCRDVLAAGQASVHRPDGLFSVVEDLPQTIPTQMISPRNSWGFRGTRTFTAIPHALKVRFVNPEKDWQQDERIVYADGYHEANASQFEAFELTGVTDPEQAWKLGRYHLAVATLRPETYEVRMDVEHLTCNRGDLVLVQHDVPLFGLITGRIKSVTTDGFGRTTAITLDEPCTMQAGDRYGVRIRLSDNTYAQREVQNVPGVQSTLTLLSPI